MAFVAYYPSIFLEGMTEATENLSKKFLPRFERGASRICLERSFLVTPGPLGKANSLPVGQHIFRML